MHLKGFVDYMQLSIVVVWCRN